MYLEFILTSHLASFLASSLTFSLAFYLDLFGILRSILSGIYLTFYSAIPSGIHFDILSSILSGIYFDIRSDNGTATRPQLRARGWQGGGRKETSNSDKIPETGRFIMKTCVLLHKHVKIIHHHADDIALQADCRSVLFRDIP